MIQHLYVSYYLSGMCIFFVLFWHTDHAKFMILSVSSIVHKMGLVQIIFINNASINNFLCYSCDTSWIAYATNKPLNFDDSSHFNFFVKKLGGYKEISKIVRSRNLRLRSILFM